ncbi:hypothetical protein L1787_09495 [Acuticoccus sp. M5D2P5]|uniref:hypothetical protein n=1 Tax=Acuticoccus kalidii TaxID=2910977 RepID=UPI001F489230|nr:hypothetical protein [Acuticoccus kalidii]MCF3933645.1 hypothetical protein [Acuticoccus kalidii]
MCGLLKSAAFALALLAAVPAWSNRAEAQSTNDAVAVVSALYAAHAALLEADGTPIYLAPRIAARFFDPSVTSRLASATIEFDFLYDAQDFEITELEIAADPDIPQVDETYFVVVTFSNFGAPQRLLYTLRADNPSGELMVTNIIAQNWTLSDLLS